MLRLDSAAPHAGRKGEARSLAKPALIAAAAVTLALTNAVCAESLAQPSDDSLQRRAAGYIAFREDVAAIEAKPFTSAEVTREAHRRLSTHDARALSSGWVAYAALVAADTPSFRDAIGDEIKGAKFNGLKGRDALFAQMAQDPYYVRRLKGVQEAVDKVMAMTAADAARFSALGEAFKAQAYAMQKTKWGVAKLSPPPARLEDADAYGASRGATSSDLPATTDKGVTQPMLANASGAWSPDWGKSSPGRVNGENAEVIMTRVLNLAARYSADGMNGKLVDVYAKNDRSDSCLSMARLTLRQCIAATRAPYEEAFCIGEHALNDVSACLGWVASAGGGS
ncbi:MAG: hypothetical protein HXY23_10970 [Parvularculaceae bacterium]|nr:hypothetical protein [Parvularculaceae bacterium]